MANASVNLADNDGQMLGYEVVFFFRFRMYVFENIEAFKAVNLMRCCNIRSDLTFNASSCRIIQAKEMEAFA